MTSKEDGEVLDVEEIASIRAHTTAVEARRTLIHAIGIVSAAIVLVAVSAVAIERRERGTSQDFGTLQAPVTDNDLQRAKLVRQVRDAIMQLESESAVVSAGFRGSLRGWVFGNERNDNDASLAEALAGVIDSRHVLDGGLHPGGDVLVFACRDSFGVFVRSAVLVADVDTQWWAANDCPEVPTWLVGVPRYFVVGATR